MDECADLGKAHLRVARPTDDLAAVVEFYRTGLGFDLLSEFRDHDGFDGAILGRKIALNQTEVETCIKIVESMGRRLFAGILH